MLYHQPHNSMGNYSYNARFYDRVDIRPHFHRNFELIHVLSGRVLCVSGEHRAMAEPGDFVLCLSNEVHSLKSQGDSRCWVGVFSGDFVHAFTRQTQGKHGDGALFRCSPDVEAFLLQNLIRQQAPPVYLLKACLYAVCSEYDRAIRLVPKADKSGLLMQAVTDYISENYKRDIRLSDMADALGYNYHYLSKRFHRLFSMPFKEYLNFYRLDAAIALLTETDREIGEIALESGFQSIRSFNHFFKTHTGMTPADYRNGPRK